MFTYFDNVLSAYNFEFSNNCISIRSLLFNFAFYTAKRLFKKHSFTKTKRSACANYPKHSRTSESKSAQTTGKHTFPMTSHLCTTPLALDQNRTIAMTTSQPHGSSPPSRPWVRKKHKHTRICRLDHRPPFTQHTIVLERVPLA